MLVLSLLSCSIGSIQSRYGGIRLEFEAHVKFVILVSNTAACWFRFEVVHGKHLLYCCDRTTKL